MQNLKFLLNELEERPQYFSGEDAIVQVLTSIVIRSTALRKGP